MNKVIDTTPVLIPGLGVIKIRKVADGDTIFTTYELDEFQLKDLGIEVSSSGDRRTQKFWVKIGSHQGNFNIAKRGEECRT